jgi:hypothetical protein
MPIDTKRSLAAAIDNSGALKTQARTLEVYRQLGAQAGNPTPIA